MRNLVRNIRVSGLFSKYDYAIDLAPGESVEKDDRLRLLYGSNGSGKSTVLRLLFHALSTVPDRGHVTALSRLPFEQFTVDLDDGFISAKREAFNSSTKVTMSAQTPDGSSECAYLVAEDGRLVERTESEPGLLESLIWDLQILPVILTDSRQIVSDLLPDRGRNQRQQRFEVFGTGSSAVDELVNEQRDEDLIRAITQVERYLARLTLAGSREGSSQIDTIYAAVADGIVDNPVPRGRPAQWILPSLSARITRIGKRASAYTQYGLLQEFPQEQLLSAVARAQDKTGPTLVSLLTPYLDSSEKRLESLSPALNAIDTYVTTVNSFLDGKSLSYSPGAGVAVLDDELGTAIATPGLSSGEKHLLLLLSYVVALRESTQLIIIDEPEISLNPGWQRILVPKLLDCLEGTRAHLLLATHSIEILAPHTRDIRKLDGSSSDA